MLEDLVYEKFVRDITECLRVGKNIQEIYESVKDRDNNTYYGVIAHKKDDKDAIKKWVKTKEIRE